MLTRLTDEKKKRLDHKVLSFSSMLDTRIEWRFCFSKLFYGLENSKDRWVPRQCDHPGTNCSTETESKQVHNDIERPSTPWWRSSEPEGHCTTRWNPLMCISQQPCIAQRRHVAKTYQPLQCQNVGKVQKFRQSLFCLKFIVNRMM